MQNSPNCEARSCRGKAIWLKMIAGIGIINSRNASGNVRIRRCIQPNRKRTMPTVVPMIDSLVRNISAPSRPASRAARLPRITTSPKMDGRTGVANSRSRRSQAK
jgi:hypothetical protein